jgi:hypothetical protein
MPSTSSRLIINKHLHLRHHTNLGWLSSCELALPPSHKLRIVIAQCMDREKVLFATHQLFGTTSNLWEMYCNTHANINSIM